MKSEKMKNFFDSRLGRTTVILSAALLIGLAVYLNFRWFYDPATALTFNGADEQKNAEPVAADATVSGENDYFTSTALTRQQSRAEAIDVLKQVTANTASSEEAKAEAQTKISKIAADIQNESNIESLVKAKGFEECVTIIGEDAVSVIVKADELQAQDTAQIMTIVYEATGTLPENVSIIRK